MKKIMRLAVFAGIALLFIAACASGPDTAVSEDARNPDLYEGVGESESLLEAINGAKMDAVRRLVIDTIGAASEEENRGQLDKVLYGTSNPNAYVDKNSMETLRKDQIGDTFVYEIRIIVNRAAVETTLKTQGLIGGDVTEREAAEAAAQAAVTDEEPVEEETTSVDQPAAKTELPSLDDAGYDEVTEEELRFVARYVDRMTYMVNFEGEGTDEFLMKSAVGMANGYLASNGMSAVDADQVEKLKKDQQMVYEEETGQEISLNQWIAQKLNSDVYIEIDAVTSGETKGSRHYGNANITLKMFNASTGELLGSVPYASPKTMSTSSQKDAILNALNSSIYKAMPVAVNQSKGLMQKALLRGIRYEMIVQNPLDPRTMSRFRSKLSRQVKELETLYSSPEETKYAIYLIGSIEDIEDMVYDITEDIPGLENMFMVMMRGKSITFDTVY